MRPADGSGVYRERFIRVFLDWVILSILRRKPAYGYEMIIAIEDEYHVFISPGSLYPILYNLERAGLVTGAWDSPDRRSKKIYELTPGGIRAHRDGFDAMGRMLDSFRWRDDRAGL